ncbi:MULTISPECIES: acyl-CoA carboxylase epsilon subunit [unclassified Streptomyces]|uniref:acyl-CoA carboxylase subunit epsilon n=1 Tax=unclassified Streptomyces TaxID=2593676 RepID=UPI0036EBB069
MTTQDTTPALELRIERGNPTPEELAAVIAVLHQRLSAAGTHPTGARRPPTAARWHRQQPTPFQPRAWRSIQFQRAA